MVYRRNAVRRPHVERDEATVALLGAEPSKRARPAPLEAQLQCVRNLSAASLDFAQRSSSGSYTRGRK